MVVLRPGWRALQDVVDQRRGLAGEGEELVAAAGADGSDQLWSGDGRIHGVRVLAQRGDQGVSSARAWLRTPPLV